MLGALTVGVSLDCIAGISATLAATKWLPGNVGDVAAWHEGRLPAAVPAEFLKPCATDGLVIATSGAGKRGGTVEVDQAMAGDCPELPCTGQAPAVDARYLQKGAIPSRHSFDADHVELSDVTHEDERNPEHRALIMPRCGRAGSVIAGGNTEELRMCRHLVLVMDDRV